MKSLPKVNTLIQPQSKKQLSTNNQAASNGKNKASNQIASMQEVSSPFSPIKTRLNVRQTLLHSLEQQEREHNEYLKEQEKLKQQEAEIGKEKSNKLKTLRKIETSDEPITKKSRKLKNLENQQDFQIANSKKDSNSIQNGNDELNSSLNVVEKDTKPSRLSLNLT